MKAVDRLARPLFGLATEPELPHDLTEGVHAVEFSSEYVDEYEIAAALTAAEGIRSRGAIRRARDGFEPLMLAEADMLRTRKALEAQEVLDVEYRRAHPHAGVPSPHVVRPGEHRSKKSVKLHKAHAAAAAHAESLREEQAHVVARTKLEAAYMAVDRARTDVGNYLPGSQLRLNAAEAAIGAVGDAYAKALRDDEAAEKAELDPQFTRYYRKSAGVKGHGTRVNRDGTVHTGNHISE